MPFRTTTTRNCPKRLPCLQNPPVLTNHVSGSAASTHVEGASDADDTIVVGAAERAATIPTNTIEIPISFFIELSRLKMRRIPSIACAVAPAVAAPHEPLLIYRVSKVEVVGVVPIIGVWIRAIDKVDGVSAEMFAGR